MQERVIKKRGPQAIRLKIWPEPGKRRCARCKEAKLLSEFFRKTDGKPESRCKPCKLAEHQRYRAAFHWGFTQKDVDRFLAKIRQGLDGPGCMEWMSSMGRGYGLFFLNGKQMQAHRAAWLFAGSGIPPDWPQVLDHRCFNKACVNVAHLRLVLQGDNASKYARRVPGRRGSPRVKSLYC